MATADLIILLFCCWPSNIRLLLLLYCPSFLYSPTGANLALSPFVLLFIFISFSNQIKIPPADLYRYILKKMEEKNESSTNNHIWMGLYQCYIHSTAAVAEKPYFFFCFIFIFFSSGWNLFISIIPCCACWVCVCVCLVCSCPWCVFHGFLSRCPLLFLGWWVGGVALCSVHNRICVFVPCCVSQPLWKSYSTGIDDDRPRRKPTQQQPKKKRVGILCLLCGFQQENKKKKKERFFWSVLGVS